MSENAKEVTWQITKITKSNERIKELLQHLKISQSDFCRKTGINKSALSNYLKGDRAPRQDQLDKIAQTFEINPAWLMGYDVDMKSDTEKIQKHLDIGEKISRLRKSAGMTLEELGNRIGVGKSTVRKWENGVISNMRKDKIAKIAAALSVSPAYLMGWTDSALSEDEQNVLFAYRGADDNMKKAIKTILGVKDEEN
jgi:transcriptional regulator with XRE-family HTH domain